MEATAKHKMGWVPSITLTIAGDLLGRRGAEVTKVSFNISKISHPMVRHHPVFLWMCWDPEAGPAPPGKVLWENGVQKEFAPKGMREAAQPQGGLFPQGSTDPGVRGAPGGQRTRW